MMKTSTDPRPFIYAGLDLAFGALYLWLAFDVAPSSNGVFEGASVALWAVLLVMAGATLLAEERWARWTAVTGCVIVIVAAVALMVLLSMSAAYLMGVFGAIGRAAATVTLLAAALVVELYVLLPALQLKFLLTTRAARA